MPMERGGREMGERGGSSVVGYYVNRQVANDGRYRGAVLDEVDVAFLRGSGQG